MMENTKLYDSLENATQLYYTGHYYGNYSVNENNVQSTNPTSSINEDISITVILSVFCLLGILGNGLVIWFSIFRMTKTVNVVWFLSLAIADFFFAFFLPLNVTQILLRYWAFETIMCKLSLLLQGINLRVSVLQLTIISVDRCLCVVFPVWCHNHRRPRLAFIIVLIIWIISVSLAIPSMMYTDMIENKEWRLCTFKLDKSSLITKTILEFVFVFLLPFIIIVSCYIVIVLHIRGKRTLASSRPLKTIVAVIIAFFICWFPKHLFSLLDSFKRSEFSFYARYYGILTTMFLIVINTCINPILYVFIGRDFKDKFCASFQGTLEKAFIE